MQTRFDETKSQRKCEASQRNVRFKKDEERQKIQIKSKVWRRKVRFKREEDERQMIQNKTLMQVQK
eukprot:3238415-Amphidinium_carterae.1